MHREAMTFFSSEPIVNLILLSVVSKPLQRALIAACTEYADRSHPLGAAVSSHSCIGCCHVAPPTPLQGSMLRFGSPAYPKLGSL